jgi:MFS family permease
MKRVPIWPGHASWVTLSVAPPKEISMLSPATFVRLTLPLAGVNILNQASRALLATIGPALALEFGLSATELSLLAATFFASYALAQLPAGLGMDLFGVRRVQGVLVLVAGLGFLLCALSGSIGGLAVGRFVTGLGVAVGMIAMLTVHTQ